MVLQYQTFDRSNVLFLYCISYDTLFAISVHEMAFCYSFMHLLIHTNSHKVSWSARKKNNRLRNLWCHKNKFWTCVDIIWSDCLPNSFLVTVVAVVFVAVNVVAAPLTPGNIFLVWLLNFVAMSLLHKVFCSAFVFRYRCWQ